MKRHAINVLTVDLGAIAIKTAGGAKKERTIRIQNKSWVSCYQL